MNHNVRWSKRGQKKAVWRCASRIDYGTKYCHDSPTLHEGSLHAAILSAVNSAVSRKPALVAQIEDALRTGLAPVPGEPMSIFDVDQRLSELNQQFQGLFSTSREDGGYLKHTDIFRRITEEMALDLEAEVCYTGGNNATECVSDDENPLYLPWQYTS